MIFKQLEPNSISVTPFVVHKYWDIDSSNTASGVLSYGGQYYSGPLRNLNVNTLATTTDNFPKAMIHQSIRSMFAGDYTDAPLEKIGESNNLQERILYENVNVISVPQKLMGESIKKQRLEFDIDLPNNVYLLNNSSFLESQSISVSSDPYTIPTYNEWYCGINNTAIITGQKLSITNALTSPTELYQLIPSSSIIGGNYLFNVNVANMTVTNVTVLTVRIYQPFVQNTLFSIDITNLNEDLQASIQLDPSADALIILRYPNPINNTITYNNVSISELETRLIRDDGNGNLIDVLYSQSSAEVKNDITPNIQGEWNFRNGYQIKNTFIENQQTRDYSRFKNNGNLNHVMFTDGPYSTKATFQYTGSKTIETITALLQDENNNIIKVPINIQLTLPDNYIRTPYNSYENLYNFKRNDDFCISGMVEILNDESIDIPTLPYIHIKGTGALFMVYTATAGKTLSFIYNGVAMGVTTTAFIMTYSQPTTPTYDLKIYGDIDEIKSILIPINSHITIFNILPAINLTSLNISAFTYIYPIITLPTASAITDFSNTNNTIYIPFTSGTFSPDNSIYIYLNDNNYNYTQVNTILDYFNTYHTNSLNIGSVLNLENNIGCYDANGLIMSASLSSSGWTVIP